MINSFTSKLSIHVVKHISYINNYLKARQAKVLHVQDAPLCLWFVC